MSVISPDLLVMLDVIDRTGSFARAARELDRVPSAITYAVRKLEDSLDVLLFDRSGHRARLTPAGQTLLNEGRHVLESLDELARRVQLVGSGWEAELRIAVNAVLCWTPLYEIIERFQSLATGTRLRFSTEVLSGAWEALAAGRADLVIGADSGMAPAGRYGSQHLGAQDFMFCVASRHPLANAPEPLSEADLARHCAVVVADTSRGSSTQTRGLLGAQNTLVMPSMQAKIDAQVRGLGVGYIATPLARPLIESGALVARKTVAGHPLDEHLVVAWNRQTEGRALDWWLQMLKSPLLQNALLQ